MCGWPFASEEVLSCGGAVVSRYLGFGGWYAVFAVGCQSLKEAAWWAFQVYLDRAPIGGCEKLWLWARIFCAKGARCVLDAALGRED